MICPSCGFEVDEQALTCPYCDAELTSTSPLHATVASWCASCGALLNPGDTVCPSCGAARADVPAAPSFPPERPKEEETLLSSAIPSESEEEVPLRHTPAPLTRYVAAICAGAVAIIALVLVIWQPWVSRDTTPEHIEPTPSQNNPGFINALSGQDFNETAMTRLGPQGSRTTIEWAHDGYDIMIGLAARLKANWALLEQVADGTVTGGLDAGRDEASAIATETLTLYQDVAGAPEDEDHLLDVGQLMNLIEWLETSSKGVLAGWEAAMENEGDARGEAIAAALDESGANEASASFVEHYVEWEPKER